MATAQVAAEGASCTSSEGYLHMRLCEAWSAKEREGVVSPAAAPHIGERARVRQLGGRLGMVAHFTPHRAKKRPLNQTQLNSTLLPFDADRFHFGKTQPEEVLMCFNPRQEGACQHTDAKNTCLMPRYASLWPYGSEACGRNSSEPAVVLVNINPVCHLHSLLVPGLREMQPQVLTEDAIVLGLAFAMRASRRLWLSFNSIGAGASVNHLHWQAFFASPSDAEDTEFPLAVHLRSGGAEKAATSRGPVSLAFTPAWPLRAWVFTWEDLSILELDTGLAEWRLAEFVYAFVSRLQAADVAHNLLISSGGTRVVVFPRRVQNTQGTDVSVLQVAGHEALGWWIVNREKDFGRLDEAMATDLLQAAALDHDEELRVIKALRNSGWHLTAGASKPHAKLHPAAASVLTDSQMEPTPKTAVA